MYVSPKNGTSTPSSGVSTTRARFCPVDVKNPEPYSRQGRRCDAAVTLQAPACSPPRSGNRTRKLWVGRACVAAGRSAAALPSLASPLEPCTAATHARPQRHFTEGAKRVPARAAGLENVALFENNEGWLLILIRFVIRCYQLRSRFRLLG